MKKTKCPICSKRSNPWRAVDGYQYHQCLGCGSIFVDPSILDLLDMGHALRKYDETYWDTELSAAKERSYGAALARVAESILYARREVNKYLDIGSGPGYLLDAIEYYLPCSKNRFYGVELFPPPIHTQNLNFFVGAVRDLTSTFDAGCCIEVVEHLIPRMVDQLFRDLALVSNPNALYIFNSGLPEYVLAEDPGYMDPLKRGHVVSYGLPAIERLAGKHGFQVTGIEGKTWAYIVEFKPSHRYRGALLIEFGRLLNIIRQFCTT